MRIATVIFDLDGVLVSTKHYHYLSWKAVADRLGLYFDEEMNSQLRGIYYREGLRFILAANRVHLSADRAEQCVVEKRDLYRSYVRRMTPDDVSREVWDTLAALRQMGLRLAVGSSNMNARLILERTGLQGQFDVVLDGNDTAKSKPDPEVFLAAARHMGETPGDCLVVEDAWVGIEAALAGGFPSVAIGDTARHPGATYMLPCLADLLDIVQQPQGRCGYPS